MHKLTKLLLLFACTASTKGFSESIINHLQTPFLTDENRPWLTGPLITPSSLTLPKGHFNVQPYTFFNTKTGVYDKNGKASSTKNSYAIIERVILQAGITDFMDLQAIPSASHRFTRGQHSTQFDDMTMLLNLQLWKATPGTQMPAVRIAIGASAPIGKYHKLDPDNYGIDASGNGSWKPSGSLFLGRLYMLPNKQFLSMRFAMTYIAQTPVRVKGTNTFGGAPDTKGTAYPGNVFLTSIGAEYTLSRNWVLALDALYEYSNKLRFSGNQGSGTMKQPAGESLSLAPAIEYNFSVNIGMIAGVWFTVAGKNTPRFVNGVFSVNFFI